MPTRVYRKNNTIAIDFNNRGDIRYKNPDDFYLEQDIAGRYTLVNKANKDIILLGTYDQIQDENGNAYSSDDVWIDVITKIINDNNTKSYKDASGRESTNTIFGDAVIARRMPQIAGQFQYTLEPDFYTNGSADGATITQSNTLLILTTDDQAGSIAKFTTNDKVRYIPGFETYLWITPDFATPEAGYDQLCGLYNDDTGFLFGYKGLNFVFIHRRGGEDNVYTIDIASFISKNGYTLNTQKGNVYLLKYGFLGYAPATLDVICPSFGLANLYTFNYPNLYDQTHLSQTYLPIRAELNNGTNDVGKVMTIGSINAGIIDGCGESTYTFARTFNYFNPADIVVTGNTELITFRNKALFSSITNEIEVRIANIAAAVDLNKVNRIVLLKNPTITNTPTWANVNANSIVEFSTDAVIDFTNLSGSVIAYPLFADDSLNKDVLNLQYDFRPGDIFAFVLLTTGIGEAEISIEWKELF